MCYTCEGELIAAEPDDLDDGTCDAETLPPEPEEESAKNHGSKTIVTGSKVDNPLAKNNQCHECCRCNSVT